MNLVIGNTSQQSYFYPDDYMKISSRSIDFDWLSNNSFDSIYITFAEQRIYDSDIDYLTPNFELTKRIIECVISNCKKVVVFGTCELWSDRIGTIDISTPFKFSPNLYCDSKVKLITHIKQMRKIDSEWNKINIVHPFYFNSSYRSQYFLFGKIFGSIINETPIEIGSLDFYRDMVHTKFFVKKVIESESDILIGSGRLFNVKDFVYDIYSSFNLNPDKFLIQNKTFKINEKFIRPRVEWNYTYHDLVQETIDDIKFRRISKKERI